MDDDAVHHEDSRGPFALRVMTRDGVRHVALTARELTLGRAPDCDIRVPSDVVSVRHARLVRERDGYRFEQIGRTNPTFLNGVPIESHRLQAGDRLDIAPGTSAAVALVYETGDQAVIAGGTAQTLPFHQPRRATIEAPATKRLVLPDRGSISVGRAPACDLVLPSLTVSRFHARIELADGVARLVDQASANGTYVNGAEAQSLVLAEGDVVRIGPYRLAYRNGAIEHQDDSRAVRLDVHEVTTVVAAHTLLAGISFGARPGEVLAIAGTSGAGKSTLLNALNGMRAPTSGHVLVNGADLYRAYDAMRPLIGYVPQQAILPPQLSVRRALHYVARLRLPPDVGAADGQARIDEVMRVLDISTRADVPIERLSGGQQKRASIAAELLASPGLFFLDEPTSGLDPGLTGRVTQIMHDLAAGGRTVVVVSHDVETLEAADRLVFLASGGHVVFIGTPREALGYFGVERFSEIYRVVDGATSESLRARFLASSQYRERVAPTLVGSQPVEPEGARAISWDPVAMIGAGVRRGSSTWRQFVVSTERYLETQLRDRRNLGLLLAQAPIIAFLLALVARPTDFGPPPAAALEQARAFGIGAAKLAATLPVMLAASATWFGAINAAREIVKELPVLRRERLAGLRVLPYLASKFVVLLILCFVQTALLLAVVAVKVSLPRSGAIMWAPLELWLTLALASITALGLGLLISATVSNADRAQSLVPIVLIPQLIFVGVPGTGTVGTWLSYLTITHWSVEAMRITARIPYAAESSGFGAVELLLRWGALVAMAATFMLAAAWRLARQRTA